MPPVIVQMIDNGGNMKFTYKVKLMIVEKYNQLGRYWTVIKWLTSRGHVLTHVNRYKNNYFNKHSKISKYLFREEPKNYLNLKYSNLNIFY